MTFAFLAESMCWTNQVYAAPKRSRTPAAPVKANTTEANATAPSSASILKGITGEVSGSYSWGTYTAPGVPTDAHVGMSLPVFAGYRFESGPEAGLAATIAFPEVSVRNAISDASFSYLGLGLQGGYLWRNRIAPFVTYYPYARLSQSIESRMSSALVFTNLTYTGQSFGAGTKLYLTDRDNGSVQIGLRFMYMHERYSRSKLESRAEPIGGGPAPSYTTASSPQSGDQRISGNTYQLGLFIGM